MDDIRGVIGEPHKLQSSIQDEAFLRREIILREQISILTSDGRDAMHFMSRLAPELEVFSTKQLSGFWRTKSIEISARMARDYPLSDIVPASVKLPASVSSTGPIAVGQSTLWAPPADVLDAICAVVLGGRPSVWNAASSFKLNGDTAAVKHHVPPSHRMSSRACPAIGTGILVAPQTILTARHLLPGEHVQDMTFVFGFEVVAGADRLDFGFDDVYFATQELLRGGPGVTGDWVFLSLDRAVKSRLPLKLDWSARGTRGDSVYMVGHPLGAARHLATGGKVDDSGILGTFLSDLDGYWGDSGGLVGRVSDSRPVGLHSSGEVDGFADCVIDGKVYQCEYRLPLPNTSPRGETIIEMATIAVAAESAKPGFLARLS